MKPTYRRPDVAAARRYVRAVTARKSFGSRPSKPPREWSDAYILRVANAWRRAEAAGEKPTLQIGRGHRPPAMYPGTTKPIGLARSGTRSSEHRRAVEGKSFWRQPPYRSPSALKRFVLHHAWRPGQFVILSAYGVLAEGYVMDAKTRILDDRSASPKERRAAAATEGGSKGWRNVWYGPVDELPDVLDALNNRTDDAADALDDLADDYPGLRAFEPGTIELWEVSWSKD